jgi:hypothetical protein
MLCVRLKKGRTLRKFGIGAIDEKLVITDVICAVRVIGFKGNQHRPVLAGLLVV